jgi:DNA-directed RNA polymerase subunit RPC12/RpoP
VREGINAARDGRVEFARRMLLQATRMNPQDARPWLWLSQTTQDNVERQKFLENAVAADPTNSTARRGLALLNEKLNKDEVLPEGQGVAPLAPREPIEATAVSYQCPNCGGHMQFDPHNNSLSCNYCDHQEDRAPEITASADPEIQSGDQVVDLILPTMKGHRMAEAVHILSCQRCGAQTLMDVGEKSAVCPYCGSNQVIDSEETRDLIEPQTIGLIKVKEGQIPEIMAPWLKEGWYTPDDLSRASRQIEVRPAYYPFWSFSGSLEARWSCEIREGINQTARWVPRNGTEILMFENKLVSGVSRIPDQAVEELSPFKLENLEPFAPEQLAGWSALAYDKSMADSSLIARENFVKEARQIVSRRATVGKERRDFKVGGGKWSGMTFKLILLPLWVGTYRYKGKNYRIYINGQTGKVSGQKPRDDFKKVLLWASGVGTFFVIAMILVIILLLSTG